jgi:signal transduction histidine kinase
MLIKRPLAREILGMLGVCAIIGLFLYGFLSTTASSIAYNYLEGEGMDIEEGSMYSLNIWIKGLSLIASVIVFLVMFLFLLGQKLEYLREIMHGIDALGGKTEYEIPIEGKNEFSQLAMAINDFSRRERELKELEEEQKQAKEKLVRSLSHDIRTPLTSIISYTDMVKAHMPITDDELESYLKMVARKSAQIKGLTDRLLENSTRKVEVFQGGKFLLEQLCSQWQAGLEDDFDCQIDMQLDYVRDITVDIGELQRVLDNLQSNIQKYADEGAPVKLAIESSEGLLTIIQSNKIKAPDTEVESHGIGITSIGEIAAEYGGTVETGEDDGQFEIRITLGII